MVVVCKSILNLVIIKGRYMLKHLLMAGLALLFFNSCNTQSSTEIGRDYLQSVQTTVEGMTKKVSSSVVFMEMAMKKPGRANTVTLNGLIIDEKGHIVTLYFKEEDMSDIKVWIDEQEFSAKVVKSDRINGITFLKADTDEKTTSVKFADTSKLFSGQFLIGVSATSKNLAFEPTANVGTLKAVIEGARDVVMINGFAMTHATDIPALGMPLFNLDGEIIAVGQGRTIALIDNVSKAVGKFLTRKEGDDHEDLEPWIGLNYEAISEERSKALDLPREAVRITRVYDQSPAFLGGLRAGDIVVAVDDKKISRRGIRALSQIRKWLDPEVGRTCKLTILKDNKEIVKEMTFSKKYKVTSISIEEFGLTVNDISPFDSYKYSLKTKKGVLVTGIEGGSPAATSTYFGRPLIRRGDVITEVHGHQIANIKNLRTALEDLRKRKVSAVYIRLQRGNMPTSVSLDTAIGQKTKDNGVN
jgi:serine protease Do